MTHSICTVSLAECDVTGLTPGKEYRFRVSAVNSEGESEPLTSEEKIIAKNPFDEPGKWHSLCSSRLSMRLEKIMLT